MVFKNLCNRVRVKLLNNTSTPCNLNLQRLEPVQLIYVVGRIAAASTPSIAFSFISSLYARNLNHIQNQCDATDFSLSPPSKGYRVFVSSIARSNAARYGDSMGSKGSRQDLISFHRISRRSSGGQENLHMHIDLTYHYMNL